MNWTGLSLPEASSPSKSCHTSAKRFGFFAEFGEREKGERSHHRRENDQRTSVGAPEDADDGDVFEKDEVERELMTTLVMKIGDGRTRTIRATSQPSSTSRKVRAYLFDRATCKSDNEHAPSPRNTL